MSDSYIQNEYPVSGFAKNKCLINTGILKKARVVPPILRNQTKVSSPS